MERQELALCPDGRKGSKVFCQGRWHRLPGRPRSRKAREAFASLLFGEQRRHPPEGKQTPAYCLQRRLSGGVIEGAAQRLAVHGDSAVAERAGEGIDPGVHGGQELAGIQSGEDAAEGVVAGHSVLQGYLSAEPVQLALAEALHVGPALGSAEDRAERYENHLQEVPG